MLAFLFVFPRRQPVGWYRSVHRSEFAVYHLEDVFYPIVPPSNFTRSFFTFHFFSSSLRDSSRRAQPLRRSKRQSLPPFRTSAREHNLPGSQKLLLNTLSSESSKCVSHLSRSRSPRRCVTPATHRLFSPPQSLSSDLRTDSFCLLSVPVALPHKSRRYGGRL